MAVLVALVDALRWDRVGPATPFLAERARRGARARLAEPLGFETGPAFAAGLWPEESGAAYQFVHDPERAPFRFVRRWPSRLLRRGRGRGRIRTWAFERAVRVAEREGFVGARDHLYTLATHAPPEAWPRFAPAERGPFVQPGIYAPHPTLFDLVRDRGRRFLHLGRPDSTLETATNRRLFEERWRGDEALVFVHFGEPDWTMHRTGPDDPAYDRALGEADAALAAIHARMGPGTRTIAFGDHGALAVRERIDVGAILASLPVRPWREFDYFLDSTAARFWFGSDRARRIVMDALAARGAWLIEAERERYRVRFRDRRQWEELLLLEPGSVVDPCFYHAGEPVRGMHGYRPEVLDNQAALVVDDPGATVELAEVHEMVDVFRLARRMLE